MKPVKTPISVKAAIASKPKPLREFVAKVQEELNKIPSPNGLLAYCPPNQEEGPTMTMFIRAWANGQEGTTQGKEAVIKALESFPEIVMEEQTGAIFTYLPKPKNPTNSQGRKSARRK